MVRSEREDELHSRTVQVAATIAQPAVNAVFKASLPIHRIPEALRKRKESAYAPRLVSVGPLHCNDVELRKPEMQDIKKYYANSLFNRITLDSPEHKLSALKECMAEMTKLKDLAKRFYAEETDSIDEEMLVIDGCFVLEVLYRNHRLQLGEMCQTKHLTCKLLDPVFDNALTRLTLRHDLLLLENQLPFVVLDKLFKLTLDRIPADSPRPPLHHYVTSYWCGIMELDFNHAPTDFIVPICDDEENLAEKYYTEVKHMLHLLHNHYCSCYPRKRIGVLRRDRRRRLMPSATDLYCAGIKFVCRTKEHPFQISFQKPKGLLGWFCRPCFHIPVRCSEQTEPFLRNLIAFEQCCPEVHPYFTSYAFLMNALIDTAVDVDLLEEAGVMENCLESNEEVANLLTNLCKEVALDMDRFFFTDICAEINEYSKCRWAVVRRWPALLVLHVRRTYFSTPWGFIGFCLAFITAAITVASFILDLFGYSSNYKPAS